MEALDILYSTNTIHISSVVLMRHLPELLLPQRLVSIMSLELVWNMVLFRTLPDPRQEEEKGWPAYVALTSLVASAFPSLKKLYTSIDTDCKHIDLRADYLEGEAKKLLSPVDEMIGKLGPQLQECQIAVPMSHYTALERTATTLGAHIERGPRNWPHAFRFWRPLTAEECEHSGNNLGYWVRSGVFDFLVSCTLCTGFG